MQFRAQLLGGLLAAVSIAISSGASAQDASAGADLNIQFLVTGPSGTPDRFQIYSDNYQTFEGGYGDFAASSSAVVNLTSFAGDPGYVNNASTISMHANGSASFIGSAFASVEQSPYPNQRLLASITTTTDDILKIGYDFDQFANVSAPSGHSYSRVSIWLNGLSGSGDNTFELVHYPGLAFPGAQFSGSASKLISLGAGQSYYVYMTSLYVVSAASSAPEPMTWVLMMIGLGGGGVAIRRHRREIGRQSLRRAAAL
jgi:hypothetical protein